MYKYLLLGFSLLFCLNITAQTQYTGHIGKYPVSLLLTVDGTDGTAIYSYQKFNNSISLQVVIKAKLLTLYEIEGKKKTAVFNFTDFDPKATELKGSWINLKTKSQLPVLLNRQYDSNEPGKWSDRAFLQESSTKDQYFKVLVSKLKDDEGPHITEIQILDKKTNHLVDQVTIDLNYTGPYSIAADDYNFDGYTDFSVFESSYAGPNTSRIYYLYDPVKKKFFESDFSGVSLQFDPKTKRITETNQCCAGRQVTKTIYKVVHNNMVAIATQCYIWDDKKQELVKRPAKECQ